MNPYQQNDFNMYQPPVQGFQGRNPPNGGRRPRGKRGGRGRTDKQSRDDVRRDAHRTQVNLSNQHIIDEKIHNLLCGGLQKVIKAAKPTAEAVSKQSVILPVSTRQIGFAVAKTEATVLSGIRPVEPIDFPSVYRASLMQLDMKLLAVRKTAIRAPTSDQFRDTDLPLEYLTIAETSSENVNAVANVINSIGNFSYKGEDFTVREPLLQTIDGIETPTSCNVTINNLRQTVEYLSNHESPLAVREAFYNTNSIPGAIWVGVPDNPLLVNADVIMPADYGEQNVRDDFTELARLIGLLRKKKPELVSDSVIDMSSSGVPSLLMSNYVAGQAINNRIIRFDQAGVIDDAPPNLRTPILGSVLEAWSMRELSPEDWYGGSLLLVGEIPQPPLRTMAYASRADFTAVQVGRIDSMAAYIRAYM